MKKSNPLPSLWQHASGWRWTFVLTLLASLLCLLFSPPKPRSAPAVAPQAAYTPPPAPASSPASGNASVPQTTYPSPTTPTAVSFPLATPNFPPGTEMHLIGVYTGVMPNGGKETVWWQKCQGDLRDPNVGAECHRKWAGYRDIKEIRVEVRRTLSPMVLVLMSYDPALWKLQITPSAQIERIILAGYYAQDIEGVSSSVPVEVRTYESSNCRLCTVRPGNFRAHDPASKEYQDTLQKLKTLTGLDPTSFQGSYRAGYFALDNRSY
jgi:hypothetical protein